MSSFSFVIISDPEPVFPCRPYMAAVPPECLRFRLRFKLFSRNAISILGGATTVLFNVCAKYLLPSFPLTRIFNLSCLRISQDLSSFRPQSISSVSVTTPPRHRILLSDPQDLRNSTPGYEPGYPCCGTDLRCSARVYHTTFWTSSGLQTTIISCFSN